jgi:hypothetical protein
MRRPGDKGFDKTISKMQNRMPLDVLLSTEEVQIVPCKNVVVNQ